MMAAAGITMLSSSGDGGSNPDLSDDNGYTSTNPLSSDVPGQRSQRDRRRWHHPPNFNTSWAYTGEVVWDDINSATPRTGNATGGGVSSVFTKPSWQTGGSLLAGETMRCVPDVASMSTATYNGGGTGAYIYMGGETSFGGTSLACPIWAGLTAVIDEARTNDGVVTVESPWAVPLPAGLVQLFLRDHLRHERPLLRGCALPPLHRPRVAQHRGHHRPDSSPNTDGGHRDRRPGALFKHLRRQRHQHRLRLALFQHDGELQHRHWHLFPVREHHGRKQHGDGRPGAVRQHDWKLQHRDGDLRALHTQHDGQPADRHRIRGPHLQYDRRLQLGHWVRGDSTAARQAARTRRPGPQALYTNTTGGFDTATGYSALLSNIDRERQHGDRVQRAPDRNFRETTTPPRAFQAASPT